MRGAKLGVVKKESGLCCGFLFKGDACRLGAVGVGRLWRDRQRLDLATEAWASTT